MAIARFKSDGTLELNGELDESLSDGFTASGDFHGLLDESGGAGFMIGGIKCNSMVENVPLSVFSPSDVDGLEAWFDADTINQTSGTKVSRWDNNTGFNHANQDNPSLQPTLYDSAIVSGRKTIKFENNQQLQHNAVLASDPSEYTLFYVIFPQQSDNNSLTYFHAGNVGRNGDLGVFAESSYWEAGFGTTGKFTGQSATNVYPTPVELMVATIHTSDTVSLYKNGIKQVLSSKNTPSHTGNLMLIGSRTDHSGLFYEGHIGEILVYNRSLVDSERQDIEKYLLEKWGLS